MNYKIIVYGVSILLSTFVVSGININNIFKKNRVVEARLFIVIFILSMSYLLANFIISIIELNPIM